MKRCVILALAIVIGLPGCDDAFNSDMKIASQEFAFDQEVASQTRLLLVAINGNISLTGLPGVDVVTVDGVRRVEAESVAEAEQGLAELEVLVEVTDEMVVVRTLQPEETSGRNFVVDYEITLPPALEVEVTNGNGNIAVSSIDNSVAIENGNGEIDLLDIDGSTGVLLGNGNVEARVTLPPGGEIGITVGNGNTDLLIPVSTSGVFSAVVGNGVIDIDNLMLSDLEATSKSVEGVLGGGDGAISLRLGNGNIFVSGF